MMEKVKLHKEYAKLVRQGKHSQARKVLGEIWAWTPKDAPVKEKLIKKPKLVKAEPKVKEKETPKIINPMHDDYINRNANVVIKNIKKDSLGNETLISLLKIEEVNKNRKKVLQAIKLKIKLGL